MAKGKKIGATLCAALLACTMCACGNAADTPKEETREMTNHAVYDAVNLPDSLWQTPDYYRDEDNDRTERSIKGKIQAIYYRSDYMDEESYAFAFLGIPNGVSATDKAPAVLLVHGGGGTAYWQWVQEWVNRGYVALAMDLEGNVPNKDGNSDMWSADLYKNSAYNTPKNQNYQDTNKPIEETWMYYAVSTTIRGNSLLHSLDYVNPYKIGVCGISWGGVITSIVTGYDDRFAFSIPIYSALNAMISTGSNQANRLHAYPGARVWDDDTGLSRVNTPLFLLAMDNDTGHYVDSLSLTVSHCKNAQVAFVRNWGHGHTAAFARPESYAFADSVVKGGSGLIKISELNGTTGTLTVTVPKEIKAKSAYIGYTGDDLTRVATWEYSKLQITGDKIAYSVTSAMDDEVGGVTWFYVAVVDNLGRTVSTVAQKTE